MHRPAGLIRSPYSWWDTLKLPFRYLRPSSGGGAGFPRAPRSGGLLEGSRLLFLGDLMAARNWQLPEVAPAFRELVRRADLVIINCEGPVKPGSEPDGRRPYARVRFSSRYLGQVLECLGVDPGRCVLSVANNHAADCGPEGLTTTVEALRDMGLRVVGAREGESPLVRVNAGPVPVGLVAWTDWQNLGRAAGCGVWDGEGLSGRRWQEEALAAGIRCLAALPHWGHEFRHFPEPGVRLRARELVGQGFRIIAGHHPHVVQPLETFDGGLCLYSGGNVIGPAIPLAWPCRLFAALEVALATGGPDPGSVSGYRVHPFVQLQEGGRPVITTIGQLPPSRARRFQRRFDALFELDEK